jgi:microcystin-dependent protein
MSDELDALLALSADFNPQTASLSPDTLAVFFYTGTWLQRRESWINPYNRFDEITDEQWDIIQQMVDTAIRELMLNMIGQILTFASGEFPPNVLPCDGSVYLKVDYPDLYDVLDSAFIVDSTHFAVPDLRDKVELGESGTRAVGEADGEETHQLTESELASHTHTVPQFVDTPFVAPGEDVFGASIVPLVSANTGSTGGDSPHNNMQPYLVLKKGIVAF